MATRPGSNFEKAIAGRRPEAPAASCSGGCRITFTARRVAASIVCVALFVAVASVGAKILSAFIDLDPNGAGSALLEKLDLNGEMNLPAWFSSLTLACAALLLLLIALLERSGGSRTCWPWFALAVLFGGMSFEEIAAIKDFLTPPLRRTYDLRGMLYFGWVIPGGLFVLASGIAFWKFLRQLDQRTRRLFLFAGAIYIGGALGVELVGDYLTERYGQENVHYLSATTLEETLEMTGVAAFIYALLDYLGRFHKSIELEFKVGGSE
jgi:hypothetical protein